MDFSPAIKRMRMKAAAKIRSEITAVYHEAEAEQGEGDQTPSPSSSPSPSPSPRKRRAHRGHNARPAMRRARKRAIMRAAGGSGAMEAREVEYDPLLPYPSMPIGVAYDFHSHIPGPPPLPPLPSHDSGIGFESGALNKPVAAKSMISASKPKEKKDYLDEDQLYGNYKSYYSIRLPAGSPDPRIRALREAGLEKALVGSRVLDIGCGEGRFSIDFALEFSVKSLLGIDIDIKQVQKARTALERRLKNLDRELNFKTMAMERGTAKGSKIMTETSTLPFQITDMLNDQEYTATVDALKAVAPDSGDPAELLSKYPLYLYYTCGPLFRLSGNVGDEDGKMVGENKGKGKMEHAHSDSEDSDVAPRRGKKRKTSPSSRSPSPSESESSTSSPSRIHHGHGHHDRVTMALTGAGSDGDRDDGDIDIDDDFVHVQADIQFQCGNFIDIKPSSSLVMNALVGGFGTGGVSGIGIGVNQNQTQTFDVVCCLSVTKWIHFNWGDEGIRILFDRVKKLLSPGGLFILEAQPRSTYKKKLKNRLDAKLRVASMKIPPELFVEYLASIGFDLVQTIDPPPTALKGFKRAIQVFTVRR